MGTLGAEVLGLLLLALVCLSEERAHGHSHHRHGQPEMLVTHFTHLPVIPPVLPEISIDKDYGKHIPRNLWIAVKDRNDPLPPHLKELFDRNLKWKINICDNLCKDDFMSKEFANTSVSEVYHLINPLVGAAKADIWRYSVLYTYGGVYLDDDSDMKTALDEIISPSDQLILSEEGSSSLGDCYIPTFHLSEPYTFSTYVLGRNVTAPHFNGVKEDNSTIFFHDHTLVNWGMFAAPRHVLFSTALANIVDIVTTEYLRQSVVHMTRWDKKWKQVMCTTGFVLTYSLRELELRDGPTLTANGLMPRIVTNNFKQYKGNVKAFWTGGDTSHYMKLMIRQNLHILKEQATVSPERIIAFLDGRAVMGDQGKAIYWVKEGKKYTFGSYEAFLKMGFTDRTTRHVADHVLAMIPDGGDVSVAEAAAPNDVKPADAGPGTGSESAAVGSSTAAATGAMVSSPNPNPNPLTLLQQAATTIFQRNNSECFSDDYGGSRDDFLQDKYRDLLPTIPTLVHPVCMTTYQLGNTFGYFINDIACADMTGAHFLSIKHRFQVLHPHTLVATGVDQQLSFFHALPTTRIHSHPQSIDEAKRLMKTHCHCLQFCWENNQAPWTNRIPLIREVLLPAVEAYVSATGGLFQRTVLSNETDRLYLPPTLQQQYSVDYSHNKEHRLTEEMKKIPLPLVPNVTIQYRCGDNVGFGKTKYGLLPFSAFQHGDRIPFHRLQGDPITIYIIADSPQRNNAHVYSYRCETILDRLVAYLAHHYPNSVIALKRGGDLFLDYARLVYSDVVFCSASTFCLWPSLANARGQVYYPLTPLIAKAGTNETAPKFKENFHWIGEVDMIKQFKHYRPWTRLIDELETLGAQRR